MNTEMQNISKKISNHVQQYPVFIPEIQILYNIWI